MFHRPPSISVRTSVCKAMIANIVRNTHVVSRAAGRAENERLSSNEILQKRLKDFLALCSTVQSQTQSISKNEL